MVFSPRRTESLALSADDAAFLLALADDTEDAPWMVMGDLQFWSASGFAHALRTHRRAEGLSGYVAAMLPIRYTLRDERGRPRRKQLAPDTFLAFVPEHPRTSYNLETEGMFPAFVLEVVSPSSAGRDQEEKVQAYAALGAREYALFTPRDDGASGLAGYRRDEEERFVPWLPDAEGGLWSAVLGLRLVARGELLQAETAEGRLLLTPEQEAAGRRRAEMERRRAEEERRREAEARRQEEEFRRQAEAALRQEEAARVRAEQEAARLRAELERYRPRGDRDAAD